MCRCFARHLHPFFCIAYVLYQSFLLTTQPPVAGRETAGKMCRILKKQFCRVAIFVFVTTSQPRGIAGTLTFCQAKPCHKHTLRGQSVGKTAAVSPAVCCFHYTAFFCLYNTNPSSRKHLRTKVFPDFHLTYSKNGGNLGSESK